MSVRRSRFRVKPKIVSTASSFGGPSSSTSSLGLTDQARRETNQVALSGQPADEQTGSSQSPQQAPFADSQVAKPSDECSVSAPPNCAENNFLDHVAENSAGRGDKSPDQPVPHRDIPTDWANSADATTVSPSRKIGGTGSKKVPEAVLDPPNNDNCHSKKPSVAIGSRRARFKVKPTIAGVANANGTEKNGENAEIGAKTGHTDAHDSENAAVPTSEGKSASMLNALSTTAQVPAPSGSIVLEISSQIPANAVPVAAELEIPQKTENSTQANPHISALLSSPARHFHSRIKVKPNIHPSQDKGSSFLENSVQREPGRETPTNSGSKSKKFTGKETLDRATFIMSDLIYWNPKNGTALPKPEKAGDSESGKNKKKMGRPSIRPVQEKFEFKMEAKSEFVKKEIAAPQVKIGSDGKIMLDEASLVVERNTDAEFKAMETVHEHSGPLGMANRRISSFSFRRRGTKSSKAWSEEETERFYIILSATGTDFEMMKEFFPGRSRQEMKNKYHKEQKINHSRIDKAIKTPTPLDPALYEFCGPSETTKSKRKGLEDILHQEEHEIDWEKVIKDDQSELDNPLKPTESEIEPEGAPAQVVIEGAPMEKTGDNAEMEEAVQEGPIDMDELVARDLEEQETEDNRIGNDDKKRKLEGGESNEGSTESKRAKFDNQLATKIVTNTGKTASNSSILHSAASQLPDDVIPESLETLPDSTEDMQMNTVATEGGGRILLVHEKSRVPGEPDMVHVYLLAPGGDGQAGAGTEGSGSDHRQDAAQNSMAAMKDAQLLNSVGEVVPEEMTAHGLEGGDVLRTVKEQPDDGEDEVVNVEI